MTYINYLQHRIIAVVVVDGSATDLYKQYMMF